ncbi:MAG: DoxX family membrane protein [Acidobacteriota bacterium]
MLNEDRLPNHSALTISARLLFTLIFFLSGITHFTDVARYVSLMPESIPYREFWVLLSGVVELLGAGMILFNWRPRLGAWLLVAFLVPVTILVHGHAMLYAEGEALRALQQASFLKGFAMIGAALLITQLGAGHRAAPSSA